MKTLNQWLNEYGESHRHPTNRWIHKICVPLITFSTLGLVSDIPVGQLATTGWNWAELAAVLALAF
jgi:uncharacterized membrane protein YGL010W